MQGEVTSILDDPLTSDLKPLNNSTITIRVIKSFSYRNVRNIVFNNYDLKKKTAKDLFEDCMNHIKNTDAFRPLRSVNYDTLKIYTHAHRSKTFNLVINFDNDEDWRLDLNDERKTLNEYGIKNETEISLFNGADYLSFKSNPEDKW